MNAERRKRTVNASQSIALLLLLRVSWEMNHSPDDDGFRPLMSENEERVAFAHAPLLALLLLSVLKTFFLSLLFLGEVCDVCSPV